MSSANSSSFSYDEAKSNGPSKWGNLYEECFGIRQSPINIDTKLVQKASFCNPLTIFNTKVPSISLLLTNTGHGASIELEFDNGINVHTFGGPLRDPYILKDFHLHWPSEHTLNGKRFDAEIHLVHYNEKYSSFQEAVTKPDGLAVLGFFFVLDENAKPNNYLNLLKTVRDALRKDRTIDSAKMITVYDVIGNEPINVYSYPGSLTTPGCNQNVLWMIATRTLKLTKADLDSLQKVKFDTGNPMNENYRPLQPLLYRKVLSY